MTLRGTLASLVLIWPLSLCQAIQASDTSPRTARQYDIEVLATRPTERRNFTQGLFIQGGELFVSSGLYGQSAVRVYAWPEMDLLREESLPDQIFAEGLTVTGDRIYLLTWRSRELLVLDRQTLASVGRARIGGEGWGITHQANKLWLSDGTNRLYRIDLAEGGKVTPLAVTLDGRPLARLNELEYIDGRIWANVWQTNNIVIINPESGWVEGVVHLDGLLPPEQRQANTDVLNGIAYDAAAKAIWVTGKRWPTMYQITLKSRSAN